MHQEATIGEEAGNGGRGSNVLASPCPITASAQSISKVRWGDCCRRYRGYYTLTGGAANMPVGATS